jgi:hypothetical protein
MARLVNGQYILSATEAVEIANMIAAGANGQGPILTSDSALRNWEQPPANIMFAFAPDGNLIAWWARYTDDSYVARVGTEPIIFCYRREIHKIAPITKFISQQRKVKIYYLQRVGEAFVLQS